MHNKWCLHQFSSGICISLEVCPISCFSSCFTNLPVFLLPLLIFLSYSLVSAFLLAEYQLCRDSYREINFASLPLEGNTGMYTYSHAAISDPQLRDWNSGWAAVWSRSLYTWFPIDDFSLLLCITFSRTIPCYLSCLFPLLQCLLPPLPFPFHHNCPLISVLSSSHSSLTAFFFSTSCLHFLYPAFMRDFSPFVVTFQPCFFLQPLIPSSLFLHGILNSNVRNKAGKTCILVILTSVPGPLNRMVEGFYVWALPLHIWADCLHCDCWHLQLCDCSQSKCLSNLAKLQHLICFHYDPLTLRGSFGPHCSVSFMLITSLSRCFVCLLPSLFHLFSLMCHFCS